ncbi:MAG: hypothetical protein KA297_23940 [Kofleriaceae bacterium]|jgi:hypothetical protein|nr:hypothetical protein [Kofleriaceae bacterium]MBP6840906.1 hypothetical protein [Kofleriaceae bacterium]
MRRAAITLAIVLAAPAAALAQPGPGEGVTSDDGAARTMREPDRLGQRPSGFWMSSRPAQGGAYRYRILAVGAGVLVVTGLLVGRTLRRAEARRGAPGAGAGPGRDQAAPSSAR